MRSRILYTAASIAALLVVLTIFFSIRPEGFLRRNEAAVTRAEVETAGASVSFTGKKAGTDIPRVTGMEDFMAQYPFSEFTVEPVSAVPTAVYELARWRSSTAVVGHRTHNYSQATTSALWAMTGYNEYYIIEFPDGTHALALFDRGLAAELAKGKAVTLPISARAGVNTYAKPNAIKLTRSYQKESCAAGRGVNARGHTQEKCGCRQPRVWDSCGLGGRAGDYAPRSGSRQRAPPEGHGSRSRPRRRN